MAMYHARRLTKGAPHGDGWYVVKQENGSESVMRFYCGDFRESEYEATAIAHHLTERNRQRGPCIVRDNRMRKRVNE